ncbi:hypothetical protein CsSME_00051047 [Camellia sinensis var. sinensis]
MIASPSQLCHHINLLKSLTLPHHMHTWHATIGWLFLVQTTPKAQTHIKRKKNIQPDQMNHVLILLAMGVNAIGLFNHYYTFKFLCSLMNDETIYQLLYEETC